MNLFDLRDKMLWQPLFSQGQSSDIEKVLNIVAELAASISQVPEEQYLKIPHALSSLFFFQDEWRIDTERTLDPDDPYLAEESFLAPPESEDNPYWRRSPHRITYLLSQLCYALVTGYPPSRGECHLPHPVLDAVPEEIAEALSQFLEIGLAMEPSHRFQSLEHFRNSLKWLRERMIIQSANPLETQKFLPKMRRPSNKRLMTKQHTAVSAPKSPIYEVQLWNPKFEEAFSMHIQTPAVIAIGRKDKSAATCDFKVTKVWNTVEREGQWYKYQLLVEQDRCLSRRHAELTIPNCVEDPPVIRDLGSTHGVILFTDQDRSPENCTMLAAEEQMSFPYPEDQYIQLANTHLRVRLHS